MPCILILVDTFSQIRVEGDAKNEDVRTSGDHG